MKKGISIFAIKIIASVTMVIDHIGAIFFNPLPDPVQSLILRGIGRIAFILYAFCLAEGFYHTHNRKKYALHLAGNRFLLHLRSHPEILIIS